MLLLLAMSFSGLFMTLELFRVNKYLSRFLAITPLLFLLLMLGFNRFNRDYPYYQYAFIDESYRTSLDFGYSFLVKILQLLERDHTTIVFISGCLLLFVLFKMLKSSNYISLVIFFYCAFPLIYDLNQIRNLIMYSIIVLSLVYIEKKLPIKHYLMWFLAFSMHKFAIVYLPFYYLCQKSRKQFMSLLLRLTILFGVASPLILNVLSLIFPNKMIEYLSHPPKYGVIMIFIYSIMDIFTVWWVDKKIQPNINEENKRNLEILYRFVWLPILVLPFAFYFIEVSRMQRNALLVKYIYCALAMKFLSFKERLFTLMLLISSITIYLVMLEYNNQLELFHYLDENIVKYYLDLLF